jgi:hypothetical protein
MTRLLERLLSRTMFSPADDGGAGGGGGEPSTPSAASILFPNEEQGESEDKGGAGGDGQKPDGEEAGAAGADWKEYVPDPAKSEAENAAAKAEHDKSKPAEKAPDPLDKVPDDGKYALTMPEGVKVDQELLDELSPEFKAAGLTSRQAQALTDKFIAKQTERAKAQGETWANTVTGWVDAAKNDPEIGGPKWDASVSDARRAVNTLGTPALRDYLEASGGGNHPELIRFMAKVGATIKEDNPAAGGAGGTGRPVDTAHRLFPNDAPKG